ncbi:helix-turn-helix domain-containing protein [Clostridium sp. 19966]|uniref:helix-turn-helix domain-containing protein n=1 Tax=Clostridium sp. 19966 TaxID=2768166 RepID=UPI0028E06CED|nr:helix-turn-helix domain-containing protein [Clostridium sp. 19966]MDT8717376.1 helix-turn-helix domain-containing protein [Clostridium sp. 19966]
MENNFYTIDKVAEILGMHHKTIRKFISDGKLEASKVGKQWRISEHALSVFMEKNSHGVKEEKVEDEENIDFVTTEKMEHVSKERINISTVIDLKDVNKDEYMRISNTLIAVMNINDSKMDKATLNMKYQEKESRLRIMLWGNMKFIQDMLSSISVLIEKKDQEEL